MIAVIDYGVGNLFSLCRSLEAIGQEPVVTGDPALLRQADKLFLPGVGSIPDDAPFFVKDYFAYYKTPRGYHSRSLNSNGGWNVTSALSFLNMPILCYSDEIRSAVLVIHGEKAHSCYFSKDAFAKLKGDNKKLMIIPNAVHTELYDNVKVIPFDDIEAFFTKYLSEN